MIIGGLQHFSLIDYPGKTCAVIFTRGCNFRCRYCHNPELVMPEQFVSEIPLQDLYDFLERRRGKLQAVCITGGEPTLHRDLVDMLKRINSMGYLIKLDSNGSRPDVLEKVIKGGLIDYIAMDIKAPIADYEKIVGVRIPLERLSKSIDVILKTGIDHEFRTTIARCLTSKDDIRQIAQTIHGARRYYLQAFESTKLIDASLHNELSYSPEELTQLARELERYVEYCGVRQGAG